MTTQDRPRSRFGRGHVAGLGAALSLVLACTQNLGRPNTNIAFAKPAQNENVGLGFDPGVDLSAGGLVGRTDLTGAVIPGPTGMPDRRIAFLGFASAVSAATLDRDPTPPTDGNGVSDVFVSAVLDARESVDGTLRPSIFGQALINSFRHPRCVTCHSFHAPGGFGLSGSHSGGVSKNDNEGCQLCHDEVVGASKFGDAIAWEAPLAPPAGPDLSFTSGGTPKSVKTLCDQTKANTPDPVEHFENDDKIFWAFESTLSPQGVPVGDGPVQFEKEVYDDLVEAWVQGGCRCETSEAVLDLALASRASAGNAAGNGASAAPSLTFVHNPGFDPDLPDTTNPAGWVFVAFESSATNLIAPATAGTDVFLTFVEVNVDQDANGLPAPGEVNLVAAVDAAGLPPGFPAPTRLVSAIAGQPTMDAGGTSTQPSINADGDVVAFTSSAAADLGFTKGNGVNETDVFVRSVTAQVTGLASRSAGTTGGNGSSFSPAISADGNAVAFVAALDTDNLEFADTNGVQDVYWARIDPATAANLGVFRASVATGGVEGVGGDSSNPSIHVLDPVANDVVVAFESQKTNLVGAVTGLPAASVYLYRGPLGIQTTLVSQVTVPGSEAIADGSSGAPRISPDGGWLAYESAATNLDVVWPEDQNGSTDVLLVDLADLLANGTVGARRLSIAAEGVDGLTAANGVDLSGFRTTAGGFDPQPLAGYRSSAENLAAAANSDQNLVFLSN